MRRMTLAACLAALACTVPAVIPARDLAPSRSGPFSFEIVDEAGVVVPTYWHRGRTYVLGTRGQRYLVRVRNGSGERAEVVVSVDGRDVIDGGASSWSKRGYLVEPYGELTVDGYRLSQGSVAAFRFSSVPRSYAALEGDARDVGVIGVAVFRERRPVASAEPPYRSSNETLRDRSAAPRADAEARGAPESAPAPGSTRAERRPGLGTEFGEEHESHVRFVSFERASSRPFTIMTLRYDDREGLLAAGVDLNAGRRSADEVVLRGTADPFRRDRGFAPPPRGWMP
jgi:hypothetical protein